MGNAVLTRGVAVVLLASAGCVTTPEISLTKREAMTVVNGCLRERFRKGERRSG